MKEAGRNRVVGLYVLVGFLACAISIGAIRLLSIHALACRYAAIDARELRHQIDLLAKLEGDSFGPELTDQTRTSIWNRNIRALNLARRDIAMHGGPDPTIGQVLEHIRNYEKVLDEEFALMDAGNFGGARKLDSDRVDPAYERVNLDIEGLIVRLEDRASRARTIADFVTPICLLTAVFFAVAGAIGQQKGKLTQALAEQESWSQAEAARAIEEAHLQITSVLSNLDVAVWSADIRAGSMLYVSPGHEEIYGRPPGDFYADPDLWKKMIYEEDPDEVQRQIFHQLSTCETATVEHRIRRADGERRWVRVHVNAVRDAKGGLCRLDGTLYDVTDGKLAELAQKDSELRYSSMVGNVPGVVFQFRLDPDETISFPYLSPQSIEVFGLRPEDVKADASLLMGRVLKEDLPSMMDQMRESALNNSEFHWEGRFVEPDGRMRWFKVNSKPEPAVGGTIVWDGILFDITDAKHRQSVEQDKQTAERSNEAKNEFLSRMSHELRTPLNAILGFGQLLELQVEDPKFLEMTGHMIRGGKHLLSLINEVLDISRIDSKTLEVSCEPVDVLPAVEEAVNLMKPLADERNVQLTILDPKLGSLFAKADCQRLRQVLLNLLSNAIKYNIIGGSATVSVEEAPDDRIHISIGDTGRGIPDDMKSRVFAPFDRLGAEQAGIEGTGLGLALSKRLVEVMDGNLSMADAPGGGCIFTIDLARTAEPIVEVAALAAHSLSTQSEKVVLYIEDNFASVSLMETLAGYTGAELRVSTQGRLGFEQALGLQPDMILLDMDLPDISGLEVLRMLKLDPRTNEIPVVIVSADASPARIRTAIQAGAVDYITKPFEISEIMAILHPDLDMGRELPSFTLNLGSNC